MINHRFARWVPLFGPSALTTLFALVFVTIFLPQSLPADPVITEFLASNNSVLADEDGAFPDWIEIFNPEATAADLTGYYLTDDPLLLTKWQFPATTLNSSGFLVVFASDKNRAVSGAELHTNFKLTTNGEYLALVAEE